MGRGRFPFYAVKQGRSVGIFDDWDLCEPLVLNYKGAKFKGFFSIAEAEQIMKNGDYREQGSMLEPSIKQPGCMYYSGQNTYEIGNSSTGHMCVLEFDGSSYGVPRYGGAGGILLNESSEIVYELRVGLGEVSNNAAEYLALIYGMRTALHLGMYRLQARGDSLLIVCQVGGDMAVGPELSVYHREVIMLSRLFEVFKICELTRAENGLADKAAEEGLEYPVYPFESEFP